MTRSDQTEESKRHVQRYWNDRAETYDSDGISEITSEEQREAWRSLLREWTSEDRLDILDLGCGTGVVSLLLAELDHDVTGVDLSPEMLDRAREKAEDAGLSIDFRTGDAEELPFADDAYDLVIARWLIWTLPDPEKAIREWQRVVRPGGRIVLIDGQWDFSGPLEGYEEIHGDLPLYDGRPPEEMADFLAQRGLKEVEYEPLMDSMLWGQDPNHELYITAGEVP